jgi:hypothetical protein
MAAVGPGAVAGRYKVVRGLVRGLGVLQALNERPAGCWGGLPTSATAPACTTRRSSASSKPCAYWVTSSSTQKPDATT